ncbi:hypothetical protein AAH446_06060 [Erwinia sp. P6884]|uniref:hypothetical protein n=1 Tax=Erwinia sp. P6884 TaxID=3141450 RepID=UPI00318643D7
MLAGICCVANSLCCEIQKLINSQEKLFFSNLSPNLSDADAPSVGRLTKWIENILHNDGVIFFLLGRFDENDSEVVAIGYKVALKKLYN